MARYTLVRLLGTQTDNFSDYILGLRGSVPKHSPLTTAAWVRSLCWYVGKLSPLLVNVHWFSFGFSSTPGEVQNLSYKPVRVGQVLDLHSGDVKHTFI